MPGQLPVQPRVRSDVCNGQGLLITFSVVVSQLANPVVDCINADHDDISIANLPLESGGGNFFFCRGVEAVKDPVVLGDDRLETLHLVPDPGNYEDGPLL